MWPAIRLIAIQLFIIGLQLIVFINVEGRSAHLIFAFLGITFAMIEGNMMMSAHMFRFIVLRFQGLDPPAKSWKSSINIHLGGAWIMAVLSVVEIAVTLG